MERKKTRLNESEMKVMQIVWNAGHPITGQQVLGQITEQYKGSWHPRTIYPLMRKLKSMRGSSCLQSVARSTWR